ncbi:MAG: hypothetical protein IPK79_01765 [Vampirovibrionales bacterium]|nr:hypothetical protein [Vampirovibrionales bacterium]
MLDAIIGVLSHSIAQLRDQTRAFIGCPHPRASHAEGKCICPDCGDTVIRQWVTLRCSQCNVRRPSKAVFNTVLPAQAHCTRCGCADTTMEELDNPPFYMMQYAVLLTFRETDYLRRARRLDSARAWVSPPVVHADAAPPKRLLQLSRACG